MSRLAKLAATMPDPAILGPRPNTYGVVQVVVLVAEDVANINVTGRTLEQITEDAYKVIQYVFDGGRIES
jgi:hypothetical protein